MASTPLQPPEAAAITTGGRRPQPSRPQQSGGRGQHTPATDGGRSHHAGKNMLYKYIEYIYIYIYIYFFFLYLFIYLYVSLLCLLLLLHYTCPGLFPWPRRPLLARAKTAAAAENCLLGVLALRLPALTPIRNSYTNLNLYNLGFK